MTAPSVLSSLFTRDPFTDAATNYGPVSGNQREEILTILKGHFPDAAESVVSVQQPLTAGINSQNFRIQTKHRCYVLKKNLDASQDFTVLKSRLELARQLAAEGIPVPPLFEAKDRTLGVKSEGFFWYLMGDMEGHYYGGQENTLYEIGRHIGRLFASLRRRSKDWMGAFEKRIFYSVAERKFFDDMDLQISKKLGRPETPFENELKQHWTLFRENYHAALDLWDRIRERPLEICHIDLHPHNVLVKDAQLIAFLDLDSLRFGFPVISVGYAVFKLMRNLVVARYRELQASGVQKIRQRFVQAIIAAGGLQEDEADLLQAGAMIENVKRFLFVVMDYELHGRKSQWENFLPVFTRALGGEVGFIFQAGGQP